jgi:hypothetical protein
VRENITTGDISFCNGFPRSLIDTVDLIISIDGLLSTFQQADKWFGKPVISSDYAARPKAP